MRILLTFLFLFLFGCTCETQLDEGDEGDEMTQSREPRGAAKPENWGQEKVFLLGQVPRLPKTAAVLSLPSMKEWRVPRVQTVIAAVENEDVDVAQQYVLRWKLASGTGGARTTVFFDAVGFTRLALPVEQVTLSLGFESYAGGTDAPAGTVKAHAYIGDFGVGELDPGPTYTTYFRAELGGTTTVTLPPGAKRFRVLGDVGSVLNPFLATNVVQALQGGSVICRWVLAPAAPGDPSLFDMFYSGAFMPVPGGVNRLQISNGGGGPIEGFIQFGIDL